MRGEEGTIDGNYRVVRECELAELEKDINWETCSTSRPQWRPVHTSHINFSQKIWKSQKILQKIWASQTNSESSADAIDGQAWWI